MTQCKWRRIKRGQIKIVAQSLLLNGGAVHGAVIQHPLFTLFVMSTGWLLFGFCSDG